MALEVTTLRDEEERRMAKHKLKERTYLTADKEKAVPEGHPDARFLLGPAGREIPESEAVRVGLKKGKKKADKSAEPEEDKSG